MGGAGNAGWGYADVFALFQAPRARSRSAIRPFHGVRRPALVLADRPEA